MANNIKISVVNLQSPDSLGIKNIELLNNANKNFWESKLQRVLYDNPNLIVLCENCDRFQDYSLPEYISYIKDGGGIHELIQNTAKQNNTYIVYPSLRIINEKERKNINKEK